MKKSFLLIAALLCCSLVSAQEAEEGGTTLKFIPRVDLNPSLSFKGDGMGFDFGNTSLYTLFEGNIGESDFSYSVEGHWLSKEPALLYQNTFRSDDVSWLDWANITYTTGAWDFTLGKDILALGTFEIDAYDFDSHINLSSTMWNALPVYQWGAKVGYTFADESQRVAFQVATSPYGEHPFGSGLFAGSLYWAGEFDFMSTIWSANVLQYDGGTVDVIAMGNQFPLSDEITLGLDYTTRGYDGSLFEEGTILGSLILAPQEKFSITFKAGYEYCHGSEDVFGWNPLADGENPTDYFVPASLWLAKNSYNHSDYFFAGAAAEYWILDDLRLHTVGAWNNWAGGLSLTVGATYFFDLAKYLK